MHTDFTSHWARVTLDRPLLAGDEEAKRAHRDSFQAGCAHQAAVSLELAKMAARDMIEREHAHLRERRTLTLMREITARRGGRRAG